MRKNLFWYVTILCLIVTLAAFAGWNEKGTLKHTGPVQFVGNTTITGDLTVTGTSTIGSVLTATAAEINQLHTAGALLADYVKLHAITASAAEVNTLTSSAVSNADLVKLHAVTSSAAEMNLLTGATATAAEHNLLVGLPASVTFTYAAGASNVAEVTLQAKNAAGTNMARACLLMVWLSDSSAGTGLTGTAASGAVAAKAASGTDMGILTAKKCWIVQTKTDGTYVLSITDTGKTTYYVCVAPLRGGAPSISRILATGDYGA